jgi:hypothetical protein
MAAKTLILLAAGWTLLPIALLALKAVPESGQPKASIWTQPEAPVAVLDYQVVVSTGRSQLLRPGVHYNLEYRNRSGRAVTAIGFALISFDLWNEMVGGSGAMALEELPAGSSKRTRWVDPAGAGVPFSTSLAIVQRVRFVDGEVWRADEWSLIEQLGQANFTVSSLTLPALSAEGALRPPPGAEGADNVAQTGQTGQTSPQARAGGDSLKGFDEPIDEPPEPPEPPGDR